MDKVRYSYVWPQGERGTRDAFVLSIARQFDREKSEVHFGWALNIPPHWVQVNNTKFNGWQLTKGDHFSRREGRRIAEERLKKSPITLPVYDGVLPIIPILQHISKSERFPASAREIAKQELNFNFPERKKDKSFVRKVIDFIKS